MFKVLKSLLFSLAFLIVFISCNDKDSQPFVEKIPQIDFVKTYGGSKNESARSVIQTSDNGYAVLGFTQSIDGDINISKTTVQYDYWLLKFDENDNLQWHRTYGGSKDEKAYQLIQTSDNGFAVVGYSKSTDGDLSQNNGFEDVWVLKLDVLGNILWKTTTGFAGTDKGFQIIQTDDGGFFVGGILDVTASAGLGNRKFAAKHAGGDYWALKLNSSGNIEWRKYFGGKNTDNCYGIIATSDGYLMIGSSDSTDVDVKNNQGSYDFWVIKISKTGTLIWEKSFGGDQIDQARAITKTNDGNFIIIGDTRSANKDVLKNNGGADLWAIKITTNGNLIWQKNYGGASFDVGRSIHKTMDNGFLISGSSRSSDNEIINKGQNDAWILKIDENGKQIWQKTIGGTAIDFCYDAIQLSNGNIVAVGDSNSNNQDIMINKGFSDLLIIKLKKQ